MHQTLTATHELVLLVYKTEPYFAILILDAIILISENG